MQSDRGGLDIGALGSANWSGGGFARNHELDIELSAAPLVAAEMLAQMNLNWAAVA